LAQRIVIGGKERIGILAELHEDLMGTGKAEQHFPQLINVWAHAAFNKPRMTIKAIRDCTV